MVEKRTFEDPIEEIDPIMEQAFSSEHDDDIDLFADESENASSDKFEAEFGKSAKASAHSAQDIPISNVEFPNLRHEVSEKRVELDVFSNIPVNLSVELGRSQISLKEVFELTEGSIIELERLVGEPLDLVVNGQVIAQGEVVAIDNNYGLRVTSVVSNSPS